VYPDHVIVTDGGRRFRLAFETAPGRGVGRQLRRQHFNGYDPIECFIMGAEYRAEGALRGFPEFS